MLKISLAKGTNVYSDLKRGDVFSWPVENSPKDRAIGLKLREGFIWLRSAGGIENTFVADLNYDGTLLKDLISSLPVKHEGTLNFKLED